MNALMSCQTWPFASYFLPSEHVLKVSTQTSEVLYELFQRRKQFSNILILCGVGEKQSLSDKSL